VSERRKWIKILAEDDPEHLLVYPDGRVYNGYAIGISIETKNRLRDGYQCINCLELLEHAFPERCRMCGFEIKKHQPALFQQLYGSAPDHVFAKAGGTDFEQIADEMEERKERRAFENRTGLQVAGFGAQGGD
jgi:hypothetical protein